MTSARIGGGPNTPGHFPGGSMIDRYREATARMTGSTATFICPCCGQSHQIVGRKLVKQDGNRKFYRSAVCISKGIK